jgi:hypothetical protein
MTSRWLIARGDLHQRASASTTQRTTTAAMLRATQAVALWSHAPGEVVA